MYGLDVTVEDMLIVPSKTCTACGLLTLILWSLNVCVPRTTNYCSDALSTLQTSKKRLSRFMGSRWFKCMYYCSVFVFVLWQYSTLRMLVISFVFRVWKRGRPRLSMPWKKWSGKKSHNNMTCEELVVWVTCTRCKLGKSTCCPLFQYPFLPTI